MLTTVTSFIDKHALFCQDISYGKFCNRQNGPMAPHKSLLVFHNAISSCHIVPEMFAVNNIFKTHSLHVEHWWRGC